MAPATPAKPQTTPAEVHRLLLYWISREGPEANAKARAYILANTQMGLEDYYASSASDEDKIRHLREALSTILSPEVKAQLAALQQQKAKTPDELFAELSKLQVAAKRDVQIRLGAHIRAVTGKLLPIYHGDRSIPDADKVVFYSECIAALKSGDFSNFKGQVGVGDKRIDPVEVASAPKPEPVPAPVPEPEPVIKPRAVTPKVPEPEPEEEAGEEDTEAVLLRKLLERKKQPKVDEAAVRRIVEDVIAKLPIPGDEDIKGIVTHMMGNGGFPVNRVETIVDEKLKALTPELDVDAKVDSMLSMKLAEFLKIGPAALAASTKPTVAESGELASYIPEVDSAYVVSKDMRDFLKHVYALSRKAPLNVMVVGPHGCGKTTLAEILAAEYKMRCLIMDCANIREPRDWFGYKYTDAGTVKWHRSQFDRCISEGNHVIVLDEIARTTDMIRNTLFPLLDYRRRTYLEERGDYITVGPNTIIVVTLNEGMAYTGCSTLDIALDDRCTRRIEVNYLSVADETDVLVKRTGIDKGSARKLAELADEIRAKAVGMGAVLTKTISTRRLIEAAEDYKALGVNGLTYSISNHFSAEGGDQSERAKVLLLLQGKFGSK